ncbi:hypothetical protein KW428_18645 [Vibrio fluvialis]|nr:hypothetical protein [Vibrio fluvialis]
MKSKIKKATSPSAVFRMHPRLKSLTQDDLCQLSHGQPLDFIPTSHIQRLLDLHPIPVTMDTQPQHYQCLMPIPFIERLQNHPENTSLNVTLLIYEKQDINEILATFLLYEPAWPLNTQPNQTQHIHHRLRQFKAHHITAPTERELAVLANCSPSSFRPS